MPKSDAEVLKYVQEGVAIIEKSLAKAELGNTNDAPINYSPAEAAAYMSGMSGAYQHALEMMAPPKE